MTDQDKAIRSALLTAKRAAGGQVDPADSLARAKEQGYSGPWYHGSERTDRLTEKGYIDPKRATSGPMPFFTDDPAIASNYAMGKSDTSLAAGDTGDISNYFTVHPKQLGISGRTPVSVERSWHYLSPEKKAEILNKAPRVGYQNRGEGSGPYVLHPEGTHGGLSSPEHYDYTLKREARGNPLAALRSLWHDSGDLVGNEGQLSEIYRLAGYPHEISETNAPWTQAKGVMPAMLRMQKPLDTSDREHLAKNVIPHLERTFAKDRSRTKAFGADMWDKEHRYTPKEWTKQLKEDVQNGANSHVFTSIPDKVTAALRMLGHDSILDTGGKMGGQGHTVAIPFGPEQVRSRYAQFHPQHVGKKGFGLHDGGVVEKALAVARAAGGQVDPLQQRRQFIGSNMYSHAAEAAQALPQAKGQPQQMLASLKGVKPEEIANSGAAQAFAGQPSVTREQLAQHFHKSAPRIRETNLGNYHDDEDGDKPKFEEYTIPGGENYRELLMHTPPAVDNFEKMQRLSAQQLTGYRGLSDWHRRNGIAPNPADPEYARLNEEATRSQRAYHEAAQEPKQHDFKSSHWNVPNVVAHLRMSDRQVPNGKTPKPDQKIFDETMPGTPERRARLAEQSRAKRGDKVLHLEELQSDWGQAGREKGFRENDKPYFRYRNRRSGHTTPDFTTQEELDHHAKAYPESLRAHLRLEQGVTPGDSTLPPKGPYVTSTNGWTDLGLKRALTEAARGKYDRLAWTPGQEQGERYGLAKKLSHLAYHPGVQRLLGTEHGASHPAIEENDVTPEKLPSYVGKELAERLLASEKDANGAHSVAGADLKVGGEGMKGYYDKILPGRLKEILKKLGHEAKFEPLTIKHPKDDAGRTEHTLHSVPLPPELREKILKGLPAYAAGGSIVDHALRLTAPPSKAYKA